MRNGLHGMKNEKEILNMGFLNTIQSNTTVPTPEKNQGKGKAKGKRKASTKKKKEKIIDVTMLLIKTKQQILVDEFQQLKTYFRSGTRPAQKTAIENFEKHLMGLVHEDK